MGLLIQFPGLAAALGAGFLVLYALSRRRTVAIAGVAWLLYAAYETAMHLWLALRERRP